MSSLFAGRSTLVVPLFLASLTFLLFISLYSSHPQSHLRTHRHQPVHALQRRTVTITDQVTTTIFTTEGVIVSELAADISSTSSSRSRHHHQSTSVSSSSSSSSASSSTLFFSSAETSSSSSSHTTSQIHQSSPSPTSTLVRTTASRSSTRVLVPSPLFETSSTTLSVTDEPLTLTSASPTSVARILPSSSSSASPVGATSSGFWSNKGALGGVFTVVGLVIAGIISFCLITYIKRTKRDRTRRHNEEFFNTYFGREHSRHGSSPGPDSLNYPPIDPFAAGEIVQIPGSAASLHRMVSGPSSPSSKIGHAGYSSDDGHSSHGHSSSMHHGFSSISYHTGFSEARTNFARPESPLPSQPPKSVPPLFSPPEYHSEDPLSNAAAVPLSANTGSSAYTVPSPSLGAGQINNHREIDSDTSYYADQIHSYYYGAGARAPPVPRSIGQAF